MRGGHAEGPQQLPDLLPEKEAVKTCRKECLGSLEKQGSIRSSEEEREKKKREKKKQKTKKQKLKKASYLCV
jgi:hypothetical protein